MRGWKKSRIGMVMVTLSSIFLVVTVVVMISGFRFEDQVRYRENDFQTDSGRMELIIDNDFVGIIQYTIDSEDTMRISMDVTAPSGSSIHENYGRVPLTGQATMDARGEHIIIIDLETSGADLNDLKIEIRTTTGSVLITCCGVFTTGTFSFFLLVFGAVITFMGAKEEKR
jgi:hypothetical protein